MHSGSAPDTSFRGLVTGIALAALVLVPGTLAEATLPADQGGRPDFFVLDDLYQEILAKWAQVDPETPETVEAVETVLDLARLEADLQWRPECLDALLTNTVRRLSADDPRALPALAVLYRATYLHLADELDFSQAGAVAARLGTILTASAGASGEPGSADFATALLTHTAFVAVSHRYPPQLIHARTLLEQAAEIGEPDRPGTLAALAWLAFVEEIEDRPAHAVRRLKGLRGDAPDDPELRLRLALNLLRTGREDQGELHLRGLIESLAREPSEASREDRRPAADWVRIVAIEELARLLAARGEREAAATLLERELEARPSHQGFATLLAALQPRWSSSVAVLREMLAHHDQDPGPGARWRYEQGPIDRLEGMPQRIGREWTASRPRLERVLGTFLHHDELRLQEMHRRLGERQSDRLLIACRGTLGPPARKPMRRPSRRPERTPQRGSN